MTLGTRAFGGTGWGSVVGQTDVEGARRQIAMARDAGVNLFDTADVYSGGLSEEILGKALGPDRDDVLIATKGRLPTGEGPHDAGLSRHHIMRAVDASLRRLGTDYIDLYQVHEWDGQTPLQETLQALDDLVRSGKVRYIGVSNYAAWHLMKALGTADRHDLTPFVSTQVHYSLQTRDRDRDRARGGRPRHRHPGLESDGRRAAVRQVPTRRRTARSRHVLGWGEPAVYDEERLYDIVETSRPPT